MSDNVTVNLAFTFTCPACNCENFLHAVVAELSVEDRQRIYAESGEQRRTGDYVSHPDFVRCARCGKKFRALSVGQNPNDDPNPVDWEV